eukprot:TRINITY_DN1781_c0_g2_i2.p1 TRINITY_DN1781_c0_g2~~TRINITY_DN1781_c0_g2_i2.p1  ORF type:complete len:348 (+),score=51.80 TRINITY_DN1781_c0_g2_i2:72-1115(+)
MMRSSHVMLFSASVLQVFVLPTVGYRLRQSGSTAESQESIDLERVRAVAEDVSSKQKHTGRLVETLEGEGGVIVRETDTTTAANNFCDALKAVLWYAVKNNLLASVSGNLIEIKTTKCKLEYMLGKYDLESERTPFIYAAAHGYVDIVKELLRHLPAGKEHKYLTVVGKIKKGHIADGIWRRWHECHRQRWQQTVETYEKNDPTDGDKKIANMRFAVNVGLVAFQMCLTGSCGIYDTSKTDAVEFDDAEYPRLKKVTHDEDVDALGAAVLNASDVDIVNGLVTEADANKYSELIGNMSKCDRSRWQKVVQRFEYPLVPSAVEDEIMLAVEAGQNQFIDCMAGSGQTA